MAPLRVLHQNDHENLLLLPFTDDQSSQPSSFPIIILSTVIAPIVVSVSLMLLVLYCACCKDQNTLAEERRLQELQLKQLERQRQRPGDRDRPDIRDLMRLQKGGGGQKPKRGDKPVLVLVIDDNVKKDKQDKDRDRDKDKRQDKDRHSGSKKGSARRKKKAESESEEEKKSPKEKRPVLLKKILRKEGRGHIFFTKSAVLGRKPKSETSGGNGSMKKPAERAAQSTSPPAAVTKSVGTAIAQSGLTPPPSLRAASVGGVSKPAAVSSPRGSLQPPPTDPDSGDGKGTIGLKGAKSVAAGSQKPTAVGSMSPKQSTRSGGT